MNQIHRRRWRSPAVLICTAAGVALIAVLVVMALKKPATAPYVYTDLSLERDFEDESFESGGKWYGLCQRDSIRSIADFRKTVESDQLLKAHFVGFEWKKAVIERLEKPVFAHVYFRKNDTIIRKAKPIKLPAGDEYITDGRRRVRTHCCNDFEEAPPPVVESFVEEPGGGLPPSASKMALLSRGSGASAPGSAGTSSGSFGTGLISGFRGSSSGGGDPGCTGPGCSGDPGCTGPSCTTDPGCTGPSCNSDPGCTGPSCNSDPGCTGPSCNSDPGCTGPDCKTYETPEPGTGLTLATSLAILGAAFLLRRRFLIGRTGTTA